MIDKIFDTGAALETIIPKLIFKVGSMVLFLLIEIAHSTTRFAARGVEWVRVAAGRDSGLARVGLRLAAQAGPHPGQGRARPGLGALKFAGDVAAASTARQRSRHSTRASICLTGPAWLQA